MRFVMKTWIGIGLASCLLLAACEMASVTGPEANQEQGVEAAERAQIDHSGAKGQPFETTSSDLLCADEETLDSEEVTGFSSGELLLEICDEDPVKLQVKARPLLSSGLGAVVSGPSYTYACNLPNHATRGIFNWTGFDEGRTKYDYCDDDKKMSGFLAFDRTYIVTVDGSGNGGSTKDRFYARWTDAASPDIAAIWVADRFTDVNPPDNDNAEVIWSSSMPDEDDLAYCEATVTDLESAVLWHADITDGDAECQAGLNGCLLDAGPIYEQLGRETYPSVNDDIEMVVEFVGGTCAANVYDWREL